MFDDNTENLDEILKNTKTRDDLINFIKNTIEPIDKPTFVSYLNSLISEKSITKKDLINKSNLDTTYGYQIFQGKRNPSRDKVLQLCVGGKFSLDETNKLLKLANLGALYSKEHRDSIIIFALERSLNLIDLNELLFDFDCEPLGSFE